MRRIVFSLLGVSAFLAVSGCAQLSSKPLPTATVQIAMTDSIPQDADWAAAQSSSGDLAMAYYDAKRRVHLYDLTTGASGRPFHSDGSDRASSSLSVGWVGNRSFVGFRDKEPVRDLFIGSFQGGASLVGVGAETVPLARVKLIERNQSLGALWYGEPNVDQKQNFEVFYRELDADGLPKGRSESLFGGIYPVATQNVTGLLSAFTWVREGSDNHILVRVKSGDGSWTPSNKVADVAPLTPLFEAISAGSRSWAFWHAQYGEILDQFRLEGVYSDDGKNWTRFNLKALDGFDIESASFAADNAGNVAVAAAVVRPGSQKKDKMQVKLVLSHDGGQTWSEAISVRQDPLQPEGKTYSHARAPKVEFLGPGKLIIAWQDWRTLRSAVHFSYSEDGGRTWMVSDARLSEAGVLHERFSMFAKSLFPHEGVLTIVTERLDDDARANKKLSIQRYTPKDLTRIGSVKSNSTASPSVERLKERVMQYWEAMGRRDFETSYGMMEPYFRAAVRFDIYKEKLGRVDYANPSIKHGDVYGPIGLGVAKVTVEVKPIIIQRKSLKLDPQDREIPSRWLWMDGDWYLEFNSEADEVRYTPF